MLVTTKIKLIFTDVKHQILKETMIRFNGACNYISQIAFEHKTHSQDFLSLFVSENTTRTRWFRNEDEMQLYVYKMNNYSIKDNFITK